MDLLPQKDSTTKKPSNVFNVQVYASKMIEKTSGILPLHKKQLVNP